MKFYTLIAVLAALTITFGYFFPPLMVYLVIVIGLSLHFKQALIYSLVVGLVTYLVSSNPIVFANVFLLPTMIVLIRQLEPFIFGGRLSKGCLSRTNKINMFYFAIISFILVFISNIISEIIFGLINQTIIASLLAGIIPSFIGAFVVSILIAFSGIPLLKRLNKLYFHLEK